MKKNKLSKYSKSFIELLSEIPERDKQILIERFYNRKSMQEVADQFNLTRSRIQQIENKTIQKIDMIFDFVDTR